jgi:L-threonylcarbamoyladenylate synthase
MSSIDFDTIIEHLKKGNTILYPTDTTFGLGCDATNCDAIKRIYQLKNRSDSKSLIILVESEQRLQQLVKVPDVAWDLIDFSEKPITIIYDNPKNLPRELIASDNTIAIRLTKDDFCKKLISKLKAPLVSTSANLSGEKTPKNFSELSAKIKNEVDYIVPECETFIPRYEASTIIRLSANGLVKIIRK